MAAVSAPASLDVPRPQRVPRGARGKTTPSRRCVREAMHRGADALVQRQAADGSFECFIDVGPVAVASQLVLERFAGRLDPQTAAQGLAALRGAQRPDGSFPAWLHAQQGSVPVSALAAVAMRSAGAGEHDPAVVRAQRWVDAHGGEEAVAEAFANTGDASAVYLVAAGALRPDVLPKIPLSVALTPLLERVVDGRVHAGNLLAMFSILAVASARREATAVRKGWLRAALGDALRGAQRQRAIDYIARWQNPDGSFNQALFPTQLMALGLVALGLRPDEAPLSEALSWLDARKSVDGGALRLQAIPNDVWSTAQAVLALHAVGRREHREAVRAAANHLRAEQLRTPQPRANQRRRGAKRTGGWAFQRGNPTMPDCDDTGLVLAALGTTTPAAAAREDFAAIDDGVAWLRDMQNPDGGWAAYVWNLPSKAPGPMFLGDRIMPDLHDPRAALTTFLDPPPELGDPATEGVTARVLWGLGACGVTRDDAAVCRAIEFLEAQQCESGALWDRWMTCYLPGTATAVLGLHAVGEDLTAPWVTRALQWMMDRQNPDGGFGESPRAFVDPSWAGRGPSMPAVTGWVTTALVRAGQRDTVVVRDAIQYLLDVQRPDGTFDNAGWVNPYVPPDTFYEYELAAQCTPLMALADFARGSALR